MGENYAAGMLPRMMTGMSRPLVKAPLNAIQRPLPLALGRRFELFLPKPSQ